MDLKNKVIVVTGGGTGIGRALCHRFAREQPRGIVVSGLQSDHIQTVADEVGGVAVTCDVTCEADVRRLVERTETTFGPIDLFCSNAGVTVKGGVEVPDANWEQLWRVNVMGHVYVSRAVLPSMLDRGSGYLLFTSSAAGLLTEIGSAAYSVTKHGTVALAEWLSIKYRRRGIGVSCLCPAGVATDFLDLDDPVHQFLNVSALSPEVVAENTLDALRGERFLVLPHEQVAEFVQFKAEHHDRWLHNFARVNEKLERIRDKSERTRDAA